MVRHGKIVAATSYKPSLKDATLSIMYMGIDIGGTKTLIAALSDNGEIAASVKFATPTDYDEFHAELKRSLQELPFDDFRAGCVAAPGAIDRHHGVFKQGGNLTWKNVPLQHDIEQLVHCPMLIENDANLAGLSEAMLLKQHQKVLYITLSTGIGTGFIVNQQIDPSLADMEGGQLLFQRGDRTEKWESFASGKAIFERYHQKASEIDDPKIWQTIVKDWTIGFLDLIAVTEPDVIVLGGGVGHYLPKYHDFLVAELQRYATPLTPLPPIVKAQRPDLCVIYGCYDLARSVYA